MTFHAGEDARKILMLAIAAGSVLLAGLIGLLAGLFTPWILLALVPAALAGVFLFIWYPPRFAASVEGSFDGEAIRARMGVLWKREVFIPMNALRTFESWAPPLHGIWKCRTVILRFAGGGAMLPLLSEEEAGRLVEMLEDCENG